MQNPSNPIRRVGLSTIPNFQVWMVALRAGIDLGAAALGQCFGLLLWLVLHKSAPMAFPTGAVEIFLAGEVLVLLCLSLYGLYTPNRSLLDLREHRQLLRAWLTAFAATRLLLFFMQVSVFVSLFFCIWICVLPSLYFGRHFFHWLGERFRRAGIGETSAVVYGAGETGIRLVRELRRMPELGVHVIGFVDDGIGSGGADIEGVPLLGDYTSLEGLLSGGGVDRLYIALPQVPRRTILDILAICRRHKIVFQIVPTLADQLLALVEVQDLDGVPLLGPPPLVMSAGQRWRKRLLDLALAVPLLVLVLPVLVAFAPLIRRSTGGSALVRIPVAGVGDRPFRMLRLRTLPVKFRPELHRMQGDFRLTEFGRFLRSSLLEIAPELWNVIRGEMSMVGPRPLTLREAAQLPPRHRFRLTLPPGFTGLWKVDSRKEIAPLDELELDLQYVRLRSFLLDVTVLLRSLDEILRKARRH